MSSGRRAWDLKNIRRGSHASQNLDQPLPYYIDGTYALKIPIPKQIFNDSYPVNPKTFGEKLRKARMEAGLQVGELAAVIGVSENTIINWEIRGMKPLRKDVRKRIQEFLI